MFRRGDRVTYRANGDTGTVTSKRGDIVRVKWDDGVETPVHPLELVHKENDRSGDFGESATANETIHHKEEDLMNKTINSDRPEATPPAGFRLISDNGPWHGEYHGPEAHHGNVAVTSQWNHLNRAIEFNVYSTVDGHSNFDRAELEAIPGMVKSVLESIDLAHAIEHMKANPVPKRYPRWTTITDIAVWCDEHKINPVAAYAAFEQLRSEELKAEGWKNA